MYEFHYKATDTYNSISCRYLFNPTFFLLNGTILIPKETLYDNKTKHTRDS